MEYYIAALWKLRNQPRLLELSETWKHDVGASHLTFLALGAISSLRGCHEKAILCFKDALRSCHSCRDLCCLLIGNEYLTVDDLKSAEKFFLLITNDGGNLEKARYPLIDGFMCIFHPGWLSRLFDTDLAIFMRSVACCLWLKIQMLENYY